MEEQSQQIELVSRAPAFGPPDDVRPRLDEPPPVRLIAVEDCSLPAAAGMEALLDRFYVNLLGFVREPDTHDIIYRAENCRLRFQIVERLIARQDYRMLGVAVPSLFECIERFNEAEINFVRQQGITPGVDSLVVRDPAGNPVEITESAIAI